MCKYEPSRNVLPAPYHGSIPNKIALSSTPRSMQPVHVQQDSWSVDLIAINMESVREIEIDRFKPIKNKENLQVWIDNLGPALYNPLWWRINASKPYWELISGTHRIIVLEALAFNFVYAYLWTGPWRGDGFPNKLRPLVNVNNYAPTVSNRNVEEKECYPELY